MRVRVGGVFVAILRGLGDEPHETHNQDCDPDRRISGHIHGSGRASGSRRGRRPAHSVPT